MATKPIQTHERESRIPTFRSIEEEAEFWDTHDSTEFEDEFEDLPGVKFVRARPKKAVSVRLDEATMSALTREARAKGIGPSTLVRMWVLERLNQGEAEDYSKS